MNEKAATALVKFLLLFYSSFSLSNNQFITRYTKNQHLHSAYICRQIQNSEYQHGSFFSAFHSRWRRGAEMWSLFNVVRMMNQPQWINTVQLYFAIRQIAEVHLPTLDVKRLVGAINLGPFDNRQLCVWRDDEFPCYQLVKYRIEKDNDSLTIINERLDFVWPKRDVQSSICLGSFNSSHDYQPEPRTTNESNQWKLCVNRLVLEVSPKTREPLQDFLWWLFQGRSHLPG